MNKNKIEYDLIPLSNERVRGAKYNLDSCESQILKLENSIKLREFERENEVGERTLREKIKREKKELKACEKELKKLKESDDNYENKHLKLRHEVLYGSFSVEEDEYDLKTRLPTRNLNILDIKDLEQIRILKLNLKAY